MEAKGKILIVDDNEDVLFALNLLLEPYVEKVKVTTQPSRVEHFMTTFEPDVILLDMNFSRDAISGGFRLSGANSGNRLRGGGTLHDGIR